MFGVALLHEGARNSLLNPFIQQAVIPIRSGNVLRVFNRYPAKGFIDDEAGAFVIIALNGESGAARTRPAITS